MVVGNIGTHLPCQVLSLPEGGINGKLHTGIGDVAHVCKLAVETCSLLHRDIQQQVGSLLVIHIENETQFALQDIQVET